MNSESERRVEDAAAQGRLLSLTAERPAAGGTFVARHEGRVVFVRGTAPGETVTARLLEDPAQQADARFWRAEAIDVLEAGVDRVPSVWEEAGVDGVGGAEWAHIALPAQRRIASEVMQELLQRAGVSSYPIEDVQVEPATHDMDGLGWRTRVRFAVAADGTGGMRGRRSHAVRGVGEHPPARAPRRSTWSRPPRGPPRSCSSAASSSPRPSRSPHPGATRTWPCARRRA